jgi:aminoglycoside phosphotransferase family enzyme/predicted kinase
VRHLETHISHVLLTGQFAYKIKKAVDLGFLDFSTLAARHRFCQEELRLNRRLAAELYLDVVPVAGPADAPRVAGSAEPIEYAVKMREFAQEALLDAMLVRGALAPEHIDALAHRVASFHDSVERANAGSAHGTAQAVEAPVLQNFEQIRPMLASVEERSALERLAAWSRDAHARLAPLMRQRHDAGRVRECHGDLHLGNIALVEGVLQIFDCIEFDENLRWIDTANETAFCTMDLIARGRPDFAARFLNDYLEIGGDYEGLSLFRYYETYRSLVRAKVACIRAAQPDLDERGRRRELADCAEHLSLAESFTRLPRAALIVTHGLSGAGKTFYSQAVVERLGAVRLRSDVERKRLHGLAPAARSGAAPGGGIYAPEDTRQTYRALAALAAQVIEAGFPALVDATFLKRWQRDLLRQVASAHDALFAIVSVEASGDLLERRIAQRGRSDASEATAQVLALQVREHEALGEDERALAVRIAGGDDAAGAAVERLLARFPDLAPGS